MKREQVIETLLKIERDFPVEDWTFRGIQVWPLLKRNIYFKKVVPSRNNKEVKPSLLGKINILLSKCFSFILSILENLRLYFMTSKGSDVLLFGAIGHRLNYQDRFINKYFYPLNRENALHVEYGVVHRSIYPKKHIAFYKAGLVYCLRDRLFLRKDNELQALLDKIKKIHSYFEKDDNLLPIFKNLDKEILLVFSYARLAEKIMNKFSPQEILGLCYYDTQMFGVHFAANKLNISNSDIQHGGQGYLNAMYTFEKFPKAGYNILPQKFWVWDTPSQEHILTWLSRDNYHKVECNGNPWIDYSIKNSDYQPSSSKKMILYTLQQKYLDDYILEAIALTNNDYKWQLRLHPRMKDCLSSMKEELQKKGLLTKVDFEVANREPLPILLKNCSIHISKFSGSIIEAEEVGVKTLILEAIGIKTFEAYIKWGNSVYLENPTANQILKIIEDA